MRVLTFREKQSLTFKEQVKYNKDLKQHKKDKSYAQFAGKSVLAIVSMTAVASMFTFLVMVGLFAIMLPPSVFVMGPIWAIVSIHNLCKALAYRNRLDLI